MVMRVQLNIGLLICTLISSKNTSATTNHTVKGYGHFTPQWLKDLSQALTYSPGPTDPAKNLNLHNRTATSFDGANNVSVTHEPSLTLGKLFDFDPKISLKTQTAAILGQLQDKWRSLQRRALSAGRHIASAQDAKRPIPPDVSPPMKIPQKPPLPQYISHPGQGFGWRVPLHISDVGLNRPGLVHIPVHNWMTKPARPRSDKEKKPKVMQNEYLKQSLSSGRTQRPMALVTAKQIEDVHAINPPPRIDSGQINNDGEESLKMVNGRLFEDADQIQLAKYHMNELAKIWMGRIGAGDMQNLVRSTSVNSESVDITKSSESHKQEPVIAGKTVKKDYKDTNSRNGNKTSVENALSAASQKLIAYSKPQPPGIKHDIERPLLQHMPFKHMGRLGVQTLDVKQNQIIKQPQPPIIKPSLWPPSTAPKSSPHHLPPLNPVMSINPIESRPGTKHILEKKARKIRLPAAQLPITPIIKSLSKDRPPATVPLQTRTGYLKDRRRSAPKKRLNTQYISLRNQKYSLQHHDAKPSAQTQYKIINSTRSTRPENKVSSPVANSTRVLRRTVTVRRKQPTFMSLLLTALNDAKTWIYDPNEVLAKLRAQRRQVHQTTGQSFHRPISNVLRHIPLVAGSKSHHNASLEQPVFLGFYGKPHYLGIGARRTAIPFL